MRSGPDDPKEMLSESEAAALIGVKANTLKHWRLYKFGQPGVEPILTHYRPLASIRYRRSEVLAYIEACRQLHIELVDDAPEVGS